MLEMIALYTFSDQGIPREESSESTYKIAVQKIIATASFFLSVICNRDTRKTGSTRIRQSERILSPLGARKMIFIEIHLPGTLLSQILSRGTHWKMSRNK